MRNLTAIRLSRSNEVVALNKILTITKWDREVKGYIGLVEYKDGRDSYMVYITKKELALLVENNIKIDSTIPALKYTGTY